MGEAGPETKICVERRTMLQELSRRKCGLQLLNTLPRNFALDEPDSTSFVQSSVTNLPEPLESDETLKHGCHIPLHV